MSQSDQPSDEFSSEAAQAMARQQGVQMSSPAARAYAHTVATLLRRFRQITIRDLDEPWAGPPRPQGSAEPDGTPA